MFRRTFNLAVAAGFLLAASLSCTLGAPTTTATPSAEPVQRTVAPPTLQIITTPSSTSGPSNTNQPPCEVLNWPIYTVVRGDTLGSIAQRTGTTVSALTTANCMGNPDSLITGQQLRVPKLPAPIPTGTTANLPDLVISSIAYGPSLIDPCLHIPGNQNAAIVVTVSNIGKGNADVFVVDLNSGDAHEGLLVDAPGLAAGQSVALRFSLIGMTVTGVVDAPNVIQESNENNNSLMASVPVPTQPPPCTVTP